ncbi:glycosyltransferase family 2 protein [Pseudomonas alliivorans]|uniref:glycosyltransferase family 2 protein n=1 Tax=Pseudomonas TaxID=286 RepID=UPI001AE7C933|nr:glycosyltransferase family 2 protein [Pseudomonas alliivorans]MBP0951440.1 glycosyltransferase family 2 protein [Pseudomonas alliivorans]MEE4305783.1 glycosyltransferase family 2 protein [Pseudomonas alliivorans]MEE4624303.1 glycosyltransferase family 2 protein [Pseudomonas alliivorans]MEE4634241.1 glycosyltransferase family 2 protein [Pseudomonas alliivorans]MEE4649440.1 glycosyltransferase family 2 protein [Pseudomonas alliivorans]
MMANTITLDALKVAVVIPCFNVRKHISNVITGIGKEVDRIYVVDDCCPERSGEEVEQHCHDARVVILFNAVNLGVGGAVMAGYAAALADGMDVIVKLDGDGQMDPALIPAFVAPITTGEADYTKGNRFFNLEEISRMPGLRIFGNATLSLLNKLSSGYWDLFDPTNGYTAIHRNVARQLPMGKISQRYFFESDMLFRLGTLRAVVVDIPMHAHYGDEVSNLRVSRVLGEFIGKHARNLFKRLFYNYYLRDMSLASFELPLGVLLLMFGSVFGAFHWVHAWQTGVANSAGTVMVSALPVLVGIQLILAFIGHDVQAVPRRPIHLQNKYLNSGA